MTEPERPFAWYRKGERGEDIFSPGNWPPPEPDDVPWAPLYLTMEGRPVITGPDFMHRWMRTENPLLGGVTPLAMLKNGRGQKLAAFIEEAYELSRYRGPDNGS
jgi:hypothetical protein